MSTRRLAESVEGLNSSLALAAGDLWPKKGRPIVAVEGLNFFNHYELACSKHKHLLLALQIKLIMTMVHISEKMACKWTTLN